MTRRTSPLVRASLLVRRLEYLYWAPRIRRRSEESGRGLAITGCGRSGTTYSATRLAECGLRLGHERLARDGISSWYIAPRTTERCWGPSAVEIEDLGLPLVHQVRHPLSVIASVATIGPRSWDFVARHIDLRSGQGDLVRSMEYWLQWNLLAGERSLFTYPVEDIDAVLPQLLVVAGRAAGSADGVIATETPRDLNTREHSHLDWGDLEAADPGLAADIRSLAKSYGYDA